MGDVIGEALPGMSYEARLRALLDHRVGLWDVIAQARREGRLDSRIRDHGVSDLLALVATLPNLACIAFNGVTAALIDTRQKRAAGWWLQPRHAGVTSAIRAPSPAPTATWSPRRPLQAGQRG